MSKQRERASMGRMDIPIVDAQTLKPGQPAFDRFLDALQHWGFFHLVNHGIDASLISALQEQMPLFFSESTTAKRQISRSANNPWGFYDQERTKNRVDAKEIFDVGPNEGARRAQWPEQLPQFEPVVQAWRQACHQLSRGLLCKLSQALKTPADLLTRAFEPDHSSFLRLNYYPVIEDPAALDAPLLPEKGRLGIYHHTDAGALTVLLQDEVAGLQVAHDGSWHLVTPQEGALVINIGDIVQVWSNDRYPAVLHRVVGSRERARYSAAYFYNPAYTTHYAPLPGMCSAEQPPRYREIDWGAFRAGRSSGDFADYGAEIQISDYRIP